MNIKTERINQLDPNGLKQGLWKTRYSNNQLMWEENYVNGKMQGLWRTWYDNGHLMQEGYYINENQEGEQIKYEY